MCVCVCSVWLLPLDPRHVGVVKTAPRSLCIITKSYVLPRSLDYATRTLLRVTLLRKIEQMEAKSHPEIPFKWFPWCGTVCLHVENLSSCSGKLLLEILGGYFVVFPRRCDRKWVTNGKPGRPAYSSVEPINHVVKLQPRLLLAAVSWPQSAPREQTCYFPLILTGMTIHRRVASDHLLRCHQDIRELRLRAAMKNNYTKINNS